MDTKKILSACKAALAWMLRHPQKVEAPYVPPPPRPTAAQIELARLHSMQDAVLMQRERARAAVALPREGKAAARRLRQRERRDRGKS